MIGISIAALVVTALLSTSSPVQSEATNPYRAAVHLSGKIGSRPEGSRNERRAHDYVADRFRAAGLQVNVNPFRVPGRKDSRNVVGKLDTPAICLRILMAHTDSVPPGHGAIDNASGVGVLVALAPELAYLKPDCDVWLVATGSEERQVTGLPYHAGAAALVKQVKDEGRARDLRVALSMDEVGLGRRFYLRSPQPAIRATAEGEILAAARRAGVTVRWARDSGTGNSDHREFELAGLPGAVLEVWKGIFPCHHLACDQPRLLQRPALNRALRIAKEVAKGRLTGISSDSPAQSQEITHDPSARRTRRCEVRAGPSSASSSALRCPSGGERRLGPRRSRPAGRPGLHRRRSPAWPLDHLEALGLARVDVTGRHPASPE